MNAGDHHNTHDRMIAAGVRLFTDGGAPLLRSLTAGMVAEEAGFHRQTFYRHWDTQDEFMIDLIECVFAIPDEVKDADIRRGIGRGAASFEESVQGLARREFDTAQRDPAAQVRLGLLATGQVNRDQIAVVARAFYLATRRNMVAQYTELLADWGRRPCSPLEVDDLVMALRTHLGGTCLKVLVTGDVAAGRRLYLKTALVLVTAMTEPQVELVAADMNGAAADGTHGPR